MLKIYKEFFDTRHALYTLVLVNLKTTIASTRLGWIWWVLDPLIMMLIYYFMVKVVFERGGENFHLFALCGIVSWQYFARSISISSSSITQNGDIIKQIGIPTTVVVAIPSLVQMFYATIGMMIIIVWNHPVVGLHTMAVIPLVLLIGVLGYGFGLFLSVLEVYARDMRQVVTYALRAGFFLTPILYSEARVYGSSSVPDIIKTLYQFNPMAWIIPAVRTVLLDGRIPDWGEYFVVLSFALVLVYVGIHWNRYNAPKLIKSL